MNYCRSKTRSIKAEREHQRKDLALWKRNAADLEEELTHRAGERAELHVLKKREALLEAVIEVYRVMGTESSQALIDATSALFDFDVENPRHQPSNGSATLERQE